MQGELGWLPLAGGRISRTFQTRLFSADDFGFSLPDTPGGGEPDPGARRGRYGLVTVEAHPDRERVRQYLDE